jgi:outer membrane immunogenic protein
MKHLLISSAAAVAALFATPAFAQDTAANDMSGARAAIIVGTGGNKVVDFDGQTIGFEVGYDWNLGETAVAGVAVQYDTDLGSGIFDANGTAVIGRVGGKVGTSGLVYVGGGYTRVSEGVTPFDDGIDGVRGLIGVEFGVGQNLTLKLEQRYSNYELGLHLHQTVAGIGFRF